MEFLTTAISSECRPARKIHNYNASGSCTVSIDATDLELVAVDIFGCNFKFRVVNVYRPPYYNETARCSALVLCDEMSRLSIVKWPCFIVGDFNCPNICWAKCSAPDDGIQDIVLRFINENNFMQLVNEPTRNSNILDLVLCNQPLLVCDLDVQCPIGNSDHCAVQVSIVHETDEPCVAPQNQDELVYDWQRADFVSMSNYLYTVDWHSMPSVNLTADSLWTAFDTVLQDAIQMFVPAKVIQRQTIRRNKHRYPNS